MRPPTCTDHGRLALDLALGRLDDAGARRAEDALESCPACGVWWQEAFGGGRTAELDAAVAAGFEAAELPRRRSGALWVAAAAAAVVVTAASLTLLPGPAPQPHGTPTASVQAVGGEDGVLAVMNFEPAVAAAPSPQDVFDAGFEDGELGDWSQGT